MRAPAGPQTDTVRQTTTTAAATVDETRPALTLTSPWTEGQSIDTRYTCDGANLSPTLTWSGGPAETASYAVVMTDLDSPEYAHWVVANIPSDRASIGDNFSDPLAALAKNSAGTTGYAGPCPPKGTTHTYSVTLYALSQVLEAQSGDPAPALIAAIEAAALESASSDFTYGR